MYHCEPRKGHNSVMASILAPVVFTCCVLTGIIILLQTPSNKTVNSTSYEDGLFYVPLRRRPEYGLYTCKPDPTSVASACKTVRASVTVDDLEIKLNILDFRNRRLWKTLGHINQTHPALNNVQSAKDSSTVLILQEKIGAAVDRYSKIQNRSVPLEAKVNRTEGRLNAVEKQVTYMINKSRALESRVAEQRSSADGVRKLLNQTQSTVTVLEGRQALLEAKVGNTMSSVDSLVTQADHGKQQITSLQKLGSSLETKVSAVDSTAAGLKAKLREIDNERSALENRLRRLRAREAVLATEGAKLTSRHSRLISLAKETETRGQQLTARHGQLLARAKAAETGHSRLLVLATELSERLKQVGSRLAQLSDRMTQTRSRNSQLETGGEVLSARVSEAETREATVRSQHSRMQASLDLYRKDMFLKQQLDKAKTAGELVNVARGKLTTQSSVYLGNTERFSSDHGVDGDYRPNPALYTSCAFTTSDAYPWWRVDLGDTYPIRAVAVLGRGDCCEERISDMVIELSSSKNAFDATLAPVLCNTFAGYPVGGKLETIYCLQRTYARHVRIRQKGGYLTLCEVEVLVPPSKRLSYAHGYP